MKRLLGIGLAFIMVFVLGIGLSAAPGDPAPLTPPAPLTLVNGSIVVQTNYFAGDTTKNGAGALATITGNYKGTSDKPLGMAGGSSGNNVVTAFHTEDAKTSNSGFSGMNLLDMTLSLGHGGAVGTVDANANLTGASVSNAGVCASGPCAGATSEGIAGVGYAADATKGMIGVDISQTINGSTSTAVGQGFATSAATVGTVTCIKPLQSNNPSLPCPGGTCGGYGGHHQ